MHAQGWEGPDNKGGEGAGFGLYSCSSLVAIFGYSFGLFIIYKLQVKFIFMSRN